MNTSTTNKPRQESDRQGEKKWYSAINVLVQSWTFGVMLLLFCMLGYFSIPEGEFSLNPFSGEGFNALGIRNNFRVIAQLGL
jgi:simple sugar transport system permease protein